MQIQIKLSRHLYVSGEVLLNSFNSKTESEMLFENQIVIFTGEPSNFTYIRIYILKKSFIGILKRFFWVKD